MHESADTRNGTAETSTLVLVQNADLAAHLVAVLFAAAGPLSPDDAARVLDISIEQLEDVCTLLDREPPTGLVLQRHEGRLQLITAPGSAAVVERFLGD